ncbi:MAG: AMP-binding protein, partial [Kofleriaceae bacterium]|nr:AMP-binding protein [Kofleriaceae bacterium]
MFDDRNPRAPQLEDAAAPSVLLGTGAVGEGGAGDDARRVLVALDGALVSALEAACRSMGDQLVDWLLASFATLLHRHTNAGDFAIAILGDARSRAIAATEVFDPVQLVVLQVDVADNPTFVELAARLRTAWGGATMSSSSTTAPFAFAFEGQSAAAGDASRREAHDLALVLRRTQDGVGGYVEYNAARYDHDAIARMVGHYAMLLAGIVADPARRIGELPLLTAAERQQMLVEWNATSRDYPQDACVHELFEAQVDRTPDAVAVAVAFERTQLTYRELDERANQLAHHLRGLGLGPDRLAAIFMERSLEMVVAMVA